MGEGGERAVLLSYVTNHLLTEGLYLFWAVVATFGERPGEKHIHKYAQSLRRVRSVAL